MMGMNVRVVDDNGNDIPRGSEQIGEVVASGPTVGKAYWKKPEAEDLRGGHLVFRGLGPGGRRRVHLHRRPQERHDLKRRS